MLVTLDRTHILALTYLINENIYKKEDVKRYLENRTYYPRETELLNALSNAVSDNEDINLFAGLSTALSKLKRYNENINVTDLVGKIKNAQITVNPMSVKETSKNNKNPIYTFPEFELMRGQYNNLFKYVNRPMDSEKFSALLTSLYQDGAIKESDADRYSASYSKLYALLTNIWSSYPWCSKYYDFYKGNQTQEYSTLKNNIDIYDNDEYSGLLNTALFELYKQNLSDDNPTLSDKVTNTILSIFGKNSGDKNYNMLDDMIRQSVGCSLNYSISLDKNDNYRYIALCIPKRPKDSSVIYSANLASLFAIMHDSNDTSELPADVKSAIKSARCDYIKLSNFDNAKQKIVADALNKKRITAAEFMDMPTSLYPNAVASSVLSLINRFVINGADNHTNGYNKNQLLKRIYAPSTANGSSSDSGKYVKFKYIVDMPEEDIRTFLENDYIIKIAHNNNGYHEMSSPGRLNFIGVINKIIKNFINPENLHITMKTITTSGGIEVLKAKIAEIKNDIYKNFTLSPFTRTELPLVAMAYEIIINYLNYLIVGNTVYEMPEIDVFSNAILKNFSLDNTNNLGRETDFRILVSNHIYKPYEYLYFMRHLLMNVPILENYMNSDSEVLREYRDFLNGTAFRSIVKDLSAKYDEEILINGGGEYWQKIYDMNVKGTLE